MPVIDPAGLPSKQPLPGWNGRFFHSENMTFGYWDIAADAEPLHEHRHSNEEVWNIIGGKLAITIDGIEHTARPGCAVIVPPNTPHSARVIDQCRAIVVDFPLRDQIGGVSTIE